MGNIKNSFLSKSSELARNGKAVLVKRAAWQSIIRSEAHQ